MPELDETQAKDFIEYVNDISREFDARTLERHEIGAEKYGPLKFTTLDTVEMAIEEIIDLANYARYTYVKLRLIQQSLQGIEVPTQANLGKEGFMPNTARRF